MEEIVKLKIPFRGPGSTLRRPLSATKGTKAKQKAKHAWQNATSSRAKNPSEGGTIGARPKKQYAGDSFDADIQQANRINTRIITGTVGLGLGGAAGSAIGSRHGKKKYPDAKEFGKARVPRITSLGTAGERAENFRSMHPILTQMPGKKSAVAGVAAGVPLGYLGGKKEMEARSKIVQQRKKKVATVQKNDPFDVAKRLNTTPEERHKALVWNSDFTNKGPYTKDERKVAGKIYRKERLKGQGAGAAIGGAAGTTAGVLLGRRSPRVGGAAGGMVGGMSGAFAGQSAGDYRGAVKGQRKYKAALGKSEGFSAFGVSHG